jgi:hypothetical protein
MQCHGGGGTVRHSKSSIRGKGRDASPGGVRPRIAPERGTVSVMRALLVLVGAIVASAVTSVAISSGFGQGPEEPPAVQLGVEWDYRPDKLSELVAHSSAVVVAQVEAARAGAPVALDSGHAEQEAAVVPTQLVDFHVMDAIDGEIPSHFTLYHFGGPGLFARGAPPYVAGERYVLFVRRRLNDAGTAPNPDETWLAVAPDGRLEKVAGALDAEIAGPIADELDGETVVEATAEIAAASSEEVRQ